jgi:hypothetical protein
MVDTPLQAEAGAEATPTVRVFVQHTSGLFGLLGIWPLSECSPTLELDHHTYYRSKSTPRWVFYRRAVSGHGELVGGRFDPRQE